MDKTRLETRADTTLELMREIFRGLSQPQDEAWLHTELSMAQVKALLAIGKDGDPSIGVVAKELNVGLSAASQIVERLVRAGLVERRPHPHDRRVTQCVLSAEGDHMLSSFQRGPRLLRERLQSMDPQDLRCLEQGLTALAKAIRHGGHEGEDSDGRE